MHGTVWFDAPLLLLSPISQRYGLYGRDFPVRGFQNVCRCLMGHFTRWGWDNTSVNVFKVFGRHRVALLGIFEELLKRFVNTSCEHRVDLYAQGNGSSKSKATQKMTVCGVSSSNGHKAVQGDRCNRDMMSRVPCTAPLFAHSP